jgi:hypothetical protein
LRRRRSRRRLHHGRERGEHAGIEPISFGKDPLCLGEHTHPIGIDDGNRNCRCRKTAMDMAMPFAGGLDDNERDVVAHKPTLELTNTRAVIGHAQPFVGSQHVDIEPTFADIDSHARLGFGLLFGRFLALHAGRAPYHLLRTRAEGRMDHAPPRCQTPRGNCGPSHPRRGRWPPAPTHLSACADSVFRTCKGDRPKGGGGGVLRWGESQALKQAFLPTPLPPRYARSPCPLRGAG